jgi:L-ascorbate metabolism protein UlaG (beta-lactamase superfamily)
MKMLLASMIPLLFGAVAVFAQTTLERDVVDTTGGKLEIFFVGHGSLIFQFQGKVIHVDPYGQTADYTKLPKADLVLITHDHPDHLDPKALGAIRTDKTAMIVTPAVANRLKSGMVMKNGDAGTEMGIAIEAVPAYNLVNKRPDGVPFHPKGEGNGYILTFSDKRVYVAGDTENTPEMKALKGIDIAFLPMNLPYTMTPEMVADAAKAFKPKVLYPYHYGETDVSRLVALLKETPEIEVRIRKMK